MIASHFSESFPNKRGREFCCSKCIGFSFLCAMSKASASFFFAFPRTHIALVLGKWVRSINGISNKKLVYKDRKNICTWNTLLLILKSCFLFFPFHRRQHTNQKFHRFNTNTMLKCIIIPAVIVLVVGVLVSYYFQQVYILEMPRSINDNEIISKSIAYRIWFE